MQGFKEKNQELKKALCQIGLMSSISEVRQLNIAIYSNLGNGRNRILTFRGWIQRRYTLFWKEDDKVIAVTNILWTCSGFNDIWSTQ